MTNRAANRAPRRKPAKRILPPVAAAVTVLALGGCSSFSLDPANWFETRPDFGATQLPEPRTTAPTPEALTRVADAARRSGDLLSAAGFYRRAAAMNPDDPGPLVSLGKVMLQAGRPATAVAAFRAALRVRSTEREALHGLGNAFVLLDQPEKAAAEFRAANKIAPKAKTWNGLGVALDMAGHHAKAQAAYAAGLDAAPDNTSLLNNYGLSLALSGDYDRAIATLRRVASRPDSTARERSNLALAYGLAGEPDLAARIARIDLGESEVASNLAYYTWLRSRPRQAASAVFARRVAEAPGALPEMRNGNAATEGARTNAAHPEPAEEQALGKPPPSFPTTETTN